jgi:hypothetical protein
LKKNRKKKIKRKVKSRPITTTSRTRHSTVTMTSFTDMDEAIEAFLSGKHTGEVHGND